MTSIGSTPQPLCISFSWQFCNWGEVIFGAFGLEDPKLGRGSSFSILIVLVTVGALIPVGLNIVPTTLQAPDTQKMPLQHLALWNPSTLIPHALFSVGQAPGYSKHHLLQHIQLVIRPCSSRRITVIKFWWPFLNLCSI